MQSKSNLQPCLVKVTEKNMAVLNRTQSSSKHSLPEAPKEEEMRDNDKANRYISSKRSMIKYALQLRSCHIYI